MRRLLGLVCDSTFSQNNITLSRLSIRNKEHFSCVLWDWVWSAHVLCASLPPPSSSVRVNVLTGLWVLPAASLTHLVLYKPFWRSHLGTWCVGSELSVDRTRSSELNWMFSGYYIMIWAHTPLSHGLCALRAEDTLFDKR